MLDLVQLEEVDDIELLFGNKISEFA